MSQPPIPLPRGAPALPAARTTLPAWVIVAMVTLIGLNLRAALGSVPPLLPDITRDLGLSGTTQGLLTAVAVVFMGLSAPMGQKLGARIGAERARTVTLVVLAFGCAIRLLAQDTLLFLVSSAVAGVGMGAASALMPSLIAHHVPTMRGLTMGLYSTGLALGVAVAAWVAVPTERWFGDWRPALALWGLAAAMTAALWLTMVSRLRAGNVSPASDVIVNHRLPWRSPTAWLITWFTTACMIIGFSGLAWVTPMYVELGVSTRRAAAYFVVFQVVQLAAMLTLPLLTDFTHDRRPLLAIAVLCSVVGISCLLVAPLAWALPAMCLFGLGAGGGSTLALVLLVDMTESQTDAARLSGMVMLVAYLAGAVGPVLLGLLHDLTGAFTIGYAVVLGLSLLLLATVPAFHPERALDLQHPDDERSGLRTRDWTA